MTIQFADDTTLYASHVSLPKLIDIVNNDLPKVSNWIKAN